MIYDTLLFDADGTLLDFKMSEYIGLTKVFEAFHIPSQKEIRQFYLDLNDELWKGFEQGKYPRQYIFDVRFQKLLDHFHLDGNGISMEKYYREWLNKGSHLIPHALEVVSQLAKAYDLYIVTNGVSLTQYQRLKDSGLSPYFKNIFVSEDIGYQKPQSEYFDYVCNHIKKEKEKMLLIGDSLHSDILGAQNAGIASCWFHPDQDRKPTDIHPDYEITDLKELRQILL